MALTSTDLSQIKQLVSGLASKTDLERFASKTDLERFATKTDLEQFATKTDLEQFASKADLEKFATKTDLQLFANKGDLDRMESRLITSINLIQRDAFGRLDLVEARLTKLEQRLATA